MAIFFLAGFLGGLIRGVVGIIKYTLSYKDVKLQWLYFGGTALVSGLVGLIAAWAIQELGIAFADLEVTSPAFALIIGYAGGDFLENIFKTIMKKPILFQ